MTINIPLQAKHLGFGLVLIVLCVALWVGHFYGPFYLNNQWKRHRWMSETCTAQGIELDKCGVLRVIPPNSKELAVMDLCLEHGELRRIR